MGLFSGELIFGGAYYWKEFCVSKWVELDNKNSLNHKNSPKQLITKVYGLIIREGLLSEGFFASEIWGAYFREGLCFGGTYYQNFTVFVQKAFLVGLFSGELILEGAYYWREFCISKWVGLDKKKNSLKHKNNSLKQQTVTVHGLIFGRAYYQKDICI